jgi:hypothetical protein
VASEIDLRPEVLRALFRARSARRASKSEPQPLQDPSLRDEFVPYSNAFIAGPPDRSLQITVRVAEEAPDAAGLCWVGVTMVEPLLDLYWESIGEDFVDAARRSRPLRMALSCAWLDLNGGSPSDRAAAEARFRALVGDGDDISRAPD